VQVAGALWRAAMSIVARVEDLMRMIGDGRIGQVFGGQAIERSGSTVCGLHHTCGDEEHEFFG
jgi:hypothetical protein